MQHLSTCTNRSRSYPRYILMQISRKPLDLQARFQRNTTRKYFANRMVSWLMTSHVPERWLWWDDQYCKIYADHWIIYNLEWWKYSLGLYLVNSAEKNWDLLKKIEICLFITKLARLLNTLLDEKQLGKLKTANIGLIVKLKFNTQLTAIYYVVTHWKQQKLSVKALKVILYNSRHSFNSKRAYNFLLFSM